MVTIRASDYIDPSGLIVKSGELLARRTIEALRAGESVLVQLQGLSGISSSYFNIFLRMIRDEMGTEALGRIRMDFVSPLQRQVFDGSRAALLASV